MLCLGVLSFFEPNSCLRSLLVVLYATFFFSGGSFLDEEAPADTLADCYKTLTQHISNVTHGGHALTSELSLPLH